MKTPNQRPIILSEGCQQFIYDSVATKGWRFITIWVSKNVALSGKRHIEGIWSLAWAVVSRCKTIAVVNNLLLEWKSPLNSFGLNRYERCYQSDYEWKDNTFRLAAIKYPLRNLVERSAAILIARLLFYYRSNRSKYRFERCAFSLRTLEHVCGG